MVGIAGGVTGAAVGGLAWGVREGVPDGGSAATLVGGTFNLVTTGGGGISYCVWIICGKGMR